MRIFFYCMRTFDELPIAERISKETGIEMGWRAEYPNMNNAQLAAGYDVVSITPTPCGEELLLRFKELGVRCIACHSIGFDHVDLHAAQRLGIRVCNVTYPPNGVANYAIMLMMMCLRRMPYIQKCAELQDYTLRGKIGLDISNCTVGVIGTGNIGSAVIRHLSGFGCRLLAYDLYPRADLPAEYVSLEELYAQSDIITLHAPATEDNYHMICADTIRQMKRGVCIINTARGKLIDTDALIDGLRSGQVGSCALDVMEVESGLYYANRQYDVIDNPGMALLRSFPNVILSPHTAFYTEENVTHMVAGNFHSAVCLRDGTEDPHRIV